MEDSTKWDINWWLTLKANIFWLMYFGFFVYGLYLSLKIYPTFYTQEVRLIYAIALLFGVPYGLRKIGSPELYMKVDGEDVK